MSQRLLVATRAARSAGKVLREKFHAKREIHSKGKRDIVTDADYAADRTVRATIHARFPQDQFISEEDDAAKRKALWAQAEALETAAFWVLDPLDGTTNYARRLPSFCVSIALYQAQAVQIGVVYDPLRDELFSAERGHGAFVNGKPLKASAVRNFQDALVGTEWPRVPVLRKRSLDLFSRMAAHATTVRAFGSAALSLCYVASGALDVYFHLTLNPWDVAAAALIIEEAGGRVTTPTGAPWSVHSQAFVASNGHLHARTLRFFKR